MVREIAENELNGLLQLYLYLHEKSIPEIVYGKIEMQKKGSKSA